MHMPSLVVNELTPHSHSNQRVCGPWVVLSMSGVFVFVFTPETGSCANLLPKLLFKVYGAHAGIAEHAQAHAQILVWMRHKAPSYPGFQVVIGSWAFGESVISHNGLVARQTDRQSKFQYANTASGPLISRLLSEETCSLITLIWESNLMGLYLGLTC